MTDEDRKNILAQNTIMAQQALRVLGSAYRDLEKASPAELTSDTVEKDLMFMGLSGMDDPSRQQAKDAIAAMLRILVGQVIARAISRQTGAEPQEGSSE